MSDENSVDAGLNSACQSCPPAAAGKMVSVFKNGAWIACSSDCPDGSICSLPFGQGSEGECRETECLSLDEIDLSNYHLVPKRPDEIQALE